VKEIVDGISFVDRAVGRTADLDPSFINRRRSTGQMDLNSNKVVIADKSSDSVGDDNLPQMLFNETNFGNHVDTLSKASCSLKKRGMKFTSSEPPISFSFDEKR
jgi:hypothetical protein